MVVTNFLDHIDQFMCHLGIHSRLYIMYFMKLNGIKTDKCDVLCGAVSMEHRSPRTRGTVLCAVWMSSSLVKNNTYVSTS